MTDFQNFKKKRERSSFFSFFQKLTFNPYYFILILISLLGLNVYYFFGFKKDVGFSSFFFLVYSTFQTLLEVVIFVFLSNLIRNHLHKFFYYLSISICFSLILLHYFDFLLIRFMDFSIFFGVNIILEETFDNFIEILHLTGISLEWWVLVGLTIIFSLPLIAIGLHYLTMRLFQIRPLKISNAHIVKTLLSLPLGLVIFDLTFSPFVEREYFKVYQRFLPWKSTLFQLKPHKIKLKKPYKSQTDEEQALKSLSSLSMSAQKKPNIYLFIVESLREDFMTESTAPQAVAFREENIHIGRPFSNANCTQLSWYSIFHSQYPLAWADKKKYWKSGSLPLQAIKKLGYRVHVYSAAQLKYYGLKELIFGAKNSLADSYNLFTHYAPVKAAETDAKAIDRLLEDHEEKWAQEGNLFLIFLDSTHFNYSWPRDYPLKFTPISKERTNLRISNSIQDIELIKNRYRNAVHYVDSLFGKMIASLKEKGLYEESLIVFTGDHGEEFFEEGRLFHASHLSRMQTEPPIYYKLGKRKEHERVESKNIVSSHVDIFPTLLESLVGEKKFFDFFDGESIFKKKRFPFVVTVRHNGGRNPCEFFIHDGKRKMVAKLGSAHSKEIEIIALKDLEDRDIPTSDFQEVDLYIRSHYAEAINRLFSGTEN